MSNPPPNPSLPAGFFAAEPAPLAQLQNGEGAGAGMAAAAAASSYNYRQQAVADGFHQPYLQGVHQNAIALATSVQINKKRPRDEQFFRCDVCNLSLESKMALHAHVASHTTCSQCEFTAAPKIVKAHYESAHGRFSEGGFKTVTVAVPGCPVQRFRICVGNHPEDVQKWIDERKRRFPRRNNKVDEVPAPSQQPQEQEGKSSPKGGFASLLEGYSSSDASDDDEKTKVAVAPAAAPIVSSTVEEESDIKTHVPKKGVCRFFARNGSCRNGDACAYSHDVATAGPSTRMPQLVMPKDRTKDTLLGKLLVNDVKRERSLTLQLLQYLFDSDFLAKKP